MVPGAGLRGRGTAVTSLCAICGLQLCTGDGICPRHVLTYSGDDWAVANRIWCSALHRRIWPERLPEADRGDDLQGSIREAVGGGRLMGTTAMGAASKICERCGAGYVSTQHGLSAAKSRFCGRRCFHEYRMAGWRTRFWGRVDKTGACWLWTGAMNNKGNDIHDSAGRSILAAGGTAWRIAGRSWASARTWSRWASSHGSFSAAAQQWAACSA